MTSLNRKIVAMQDLSRCTETDNALNVGSQSSGSTGLLFLGSAETTKLIRAHIHDESLYFTTMPGHNTAPYGVVSSHVSSQ